VIIPNVTPSIQRDLFGRALLEVARLPEMINRIVEVDLDGVRAYELPKIDA
jgi:hypothetical protein